MTESLDKAVDEKRVIAFLDLSSFDDDAVTRGGCLVTDEMTRPLEFWVSGGIHPNSIQKMLYGDTLHEYICTDLIGIPLLSKL
ncbi:MAG: hypothetical protein V3V46_06855, partial [Anaerolineales bacterium]